MNAHNPSALFDVINPATEEVIDTCLDATENDLNSTVSLANHAFNTWSQTSDEERRDTIIKMASLIKKNSAALAKLLTQEQGKSLKVLGAEFEVQIVHDWLLATADMSLQDKVIEDSDERKALLVRKPIGVVGSITPWNWPLMIAIWHIAPAIRVGCTVVIKPSNNTPLSTLLMVEILNQALPIGVLNVITGDIGHKLSSHPGIDKLVFTGSTPVGKTIMQNASYSLKRLTLELGGNDAAIVLKDANVADIAESLFWAAFINNGQTCLAIKRLYVHDDIYDDVCEALRQIAVSMPMANGLDENCVFGPVQNKTLLNKVSDLVEDAKAHGGKILCGGQAQKGDGYFYPVTLVADADDDMRLVQEEQFGPALPILRFTDINDALERVNKSELGLGGSVWSADADAALAVANKMQCGSVWINSHGQVMPHIPFGGLKQSGLGCEFGEEGLLAYADTQAVHIPKSAG